MTHKLKSPEAELQVSHLKALLEDAKRQLVSRKRELRKSEQTVRDLKHTNSRIVSLVSKRINTGYLYLDLENGKVRFNEEVKHIFPGIKTTSVSLKSISKYIKAIRPDGSEINAEDMPHAIAISSGKEVEAFSLGIRRRTNEEISWYNVNAIPILNTTNDSVIAVVSFFENFTLKNSTEKIAQSTYRERFKMFDNMLEGVQVVGFDWKYKYVNDSFVEHARYTRAELLGHTVMKRYPGIETTRVFECYTRCFNERIPFQLTNKFVFPDDTVGWFDLKFQPIQEGIIIQSIEVTDQVKNKERLIRTNALYQTIITTSPDSIIITEPDGKIRTFSDSWIQLMQGQPDDRFIGTNIQDFLLHEDKVKFEASLERMRQLFSHEHEEFVLITNRNQVVSIEINARAIKGEKEKCEGFLFVIRDVSERKKAQLEIDTKTELLRLTNDMAKVGGWEFDPVTLEGTWTEEVAKIHDLPKEATTNVEMGISFYKPESKLKIAQAIERLLLEAIPYDLELEMISAKGNEKRIRTMGVPVVSDGKVVKVQGIIQDISSQHKAKVRLINERARLRTLIESIPDLVWLKNKEGVYILCNPKFEEFFGANEQQIVGKTDYDFVSKQQADFFREHDQRALVAQKTTINFEELTFAKNGYTGYFETLKTPILDVQGNLLGVLGIARDITAHKIAREEANRNKNSFESLFENAPVAIWREDFTEIMKRINRLKSEGVTDFSVFLDNHPEEVMLCLQSIEILNINKETVDMYEAGSKEELINNLEATFAPESVDLLKSVIISLAEGVTVLNEKTKVKTLKGKMLDVIVRLFTNIEGGRNIAFVTTVDVSKLTRAEAEIRSMNEKLEARISERTLELSDLYNNAPCGYHSLDANGYIVRINDTELSWLGYNRSELLGKVKFYDLLTDDSKPTFNLNFPNFKTKGYISDLEFDVIKKDGSTMAVVIAGTSIKDDAGNFLASRSTMVDNTERKKAEKAILAYQLQLETVNKDLESFAYSISHDLRAPLRHINGFARLLRLEMENLSTEQLGFLNKIEESSTRMANMIDDLLKFSRLGRKQLTKTLVDLNVLVQKMVSQFSAETKDRNIEWIIKDLPTVKGDYNLLAVAVENLISNAIKFTSKNEFAVIEIAQCKEKKNCFYIKDNGVGFNMKYSDKLFQVFQRLHTQSEFEGNGIGLANVDQIVKKHGGKISVESEINIGTTFFIVI